MGDSLNSYLEFDMITGKKEHFLIEHLRAPTARQALEHTRVRRLLGLCLVLFFDRTDLFCLNFQGLWASALDISSMKENWKKNTELKVGQKKF